MKAALVFGAVFLASSAPALPALERSEGSEANVAFAQNPQGAPQSDSARAANARNRGGGQCSRNAYNCVDAPNPLPAPNTVWLEEMTWMDVRDALAAGKTTVIIATGGMEPNGPWLVTGKHNYVLKANCEAIARKLGNALCAPIIKLVPEGRIDPQSGHMASPGTISLREETFRAMLTDVVHSLKMHGFKNIILIGDSGGNQPGQRYVADSLTGIWKGEPVVAHIQEYYDYNKVGQQMASKLGKVASDSLHDDPIITLNMFITDPSSVRYEERVKAKKATIDGVSIADRKKNLEWAKEIVEFRAVSTVDAIHKSIANKGTLPAPPPRQRQQPPPQLPRDEIAALARVQVAIIAARDSINVQRAKSGNKTAQAQQQLQDKLRAEVEEILHHGGLTDAEYRRGTYLVSSDTATRRVFDSVVVVLTRAPLPGQLVRGPQVPVPPGPVGTHIGHVVNGFGDTPNGQGLLSTAMGEARIAIAHATLAARQPDNLDYMKTHAGHVIHTLDPSIISVGPGLGYGLKKAATGVGAHIELAAAAQGASPGVVTHAKHVAVSARNTVARAEQLLAIAQKVQSAVSAAEAAALVSQMASLADQLIAGADANGDGRITWEPGEGGLQHADEHVKLLLAVAR